jgi:shikimate dehydrogenase
VIDGATRVYALLGDPVAHSLSPIMQNAAFRALGLRAVYVALRCRSEDLSDLMHALARAGGGGNITVPHKEAAALALGNRQGLVETVGACNTFWQDGNRLVGDNTDVDGLLAALDPLDPPDGAWLLLGTGGSARAAVAAAAHRGASVAVSSRSDTRRKAFETWAQQCGTKIVPAEECRVLINTTPLGLSPNDAPPPGREVAPNAAVALDLVYASGETAWVRSLRSAGLRAADGRAMLVAQGALALERWFPGADAPTEIMRAAVDAALR